ncbi:hypothetical protein IVA80_15230 [Bradyrhizobium sp. 139]|uniref:hypothetical protein n=1 Tax=Bradyrhizobium sp. 139 TaxID=2782616 RepID=UPI001FFB5C1F|nr:hypothetical protein [Bradyrhizobium sp. 139]MCK1742176.1 hypothetical protein [Bradyrhizobium sp. 139]
MSVLESIWHFILSWAGIDMAVGFAAVAVAVLLPLFRKAAIYAAIIAFTFTGLIAYGYNNGLAEKQRQWNAALEQEARKGDDARSAAERAVPPVSSDRSVFRSDPFNRNRDGRREDCK